MVRFETKLLNNAVREWESHYINYRALKKAIYAADADVATPDLFATPRHRGATGLSPQHTDAGGDAGANDTTPLLDPGHKSDSSLSDSPSSNSAVVPGGKIPSRPPNEARLNASPSAEAAAALPAATKKFNPAHRKRRQ